MKKLLCLLTALLLMCSLALAEDDAPLYPEGYDLLYITDVFSDSDTELYEEMTEEELENQPKHMLLQATFGAIDPNDASALIGFSQEPADLYTLGLADDCVVMLPADPLDPTEIVQIDDLEAWYLNANEVMADYFDEGQTTYRFYATFELDDEGFLSKLEYQYFDWA